MIQPEDMAIVRLVNQQIAEPKLKSVQETVSWMGAVQAQDYPMSKWAVGVRMPGSTDQLVESAIDRGEIIRTHVLRPTWHLVSAEDVYWMLRLSAPQIQTAMRLRDRELGLTGAAVTRCNTLLGKALRDGNHLTRDELVKLLAESGFGNDNNRVYHILMRAETDGIIGSGTTKAGKQTYALLAERVPETKPLKRGEAVTKLARRYFTSHGPATLADFVWWSGLPVKECRQATEEIKADFVTGTRNHETYWLPANTPLREIKKEQVFLLPAFDEYLISYKNRAAMLPFDNHIKTISSNGIFRPVIVQNGQVTGIWKRTIRKDKVILETEYFGTADKVLKNKVKEAFERYAQFLGKKAENDD